MRIVQFLNFNFNNYLIISFILETNGSFLSRMKNRYEYLPYPIKEFTIKDKDYIMYGLSLTNSIYTTMTSDPKLLDQENFYPIKYYEPSFQATDLINSTKPISEFITAAQESYFQKRTINTETALHYYDQDKRSAIKLLMALTSTRFPQTSSTTDPIKHRKKTWPSYFPPKFISKLQAELDEALLPWKSTTAILTNISTNVIANITEGTGNVKSLMEEESLAYCYMCGLDQHGIPRMPGCYHIFENEDHRTRKLQRRFKVKCIKSSQKKKVKHKYYGPDYIGGCFKRFLDVGVEYNERGCRTKKPTQGNSYASKRLAYLEKMLKDTDNGCVFSPYASLTPFSRAISLYARYHVCVCNTKYCNHAINFSASNLQFFFPLAAIFLI